MKKIELNGMKIEIILPEEKLYLPYNKALIFRGNVEEVDVSKEGTILIVKLRDFVEDIRQENQKDKNGNKSK